MSEHAAHTEQTMSSESGLPEDGSSVEPTGHEAVDGALRSLDSLEGRPVEEHVAVFEAAHEALRAALANAGERPGGPGAR